jgi:hypothetical protein
MSGFVFVISCPSDGGGSYVLAVVTSEEASKVFVELYRKSPMNYHGSALSVAKVPVYNTGISAFHSAHQNDFDVDLDQIVYDDVSEQGPFGPQSKVTYPTAAPPVDSSTTNTKQGAISKEEQELKSRAWADYTNLRK